MYSPPNVTFFGKEILKMPAEIIALLTSTSKLGKIKEPFFDFFVCYILDNCQKISPEIHIFFFIFTLFLFHLAKCRILVVFCFDSDPKEAPRNTTVHGTVF